VSRGTPAARMRTWRIGLVLAGLAIAGLGAWVMVDTVAWRKILGLATWLAAAIVLHDGSSRPPSSASTWRCAGWPAVGCRPP
jgi:hypothetical protein